MKRNGLFVAVLKAVAATAAPTLLVANAALAQSVPTVPDAAPSGVRSQASKQLDAIVVQESIAYRNRSDSTAPTLSYELEYFQRFEPLTVGDMLKRVPGVSFVSDVLEYDGARLRGLDPGYTQILINGRRVPGAGTDRSFFVDRIPAELVERIEIVRSASANRSGDAVAGALNIVLRDAYEFDGAYLRAGALRFDDGEFKGTGGGVWSGAVGDGRLLAGVNVQGRYNPKLKRSDRFEEPGGDFVDREDQTDVRDGTDYSANASYTRQFGDAWLELDGFWVRTERTESEHSDGFNDPASTSAANLVSVNDQVVDVDQDNFGLAANLEFPALGGENTFEASHSKFDDERVDTEEETAFDDEDTPPSFDEREGTLVLTDTDDRELALSFAHERALGMAELELGADFTDKDRDTALATSEADTDEEGEPLPPYTDFDVVGSSIEERRLDPYAMLSGTHGALAWEAGLRYETTDVDIAADGERFENDYSILLPSAHLRWSVTDADRVSVSLARSVRRPNFDFILPLTLEEELGDNDFAGNPFLEPERAWGVDVGFERRLGTQGVVGVNVFYRDVEDLIEVVNTGAPSATALDDFEDDVEDFLDENPGATPATPGYPEFDPDSFVFSAANVGDGEVYGVELDLSTPLTAFGLPDTGVFLNYAWLDSNVDDAVGERRFNEQARYVYNVGFIHDVADAGVSFGASYRRQGDAFLRVVAEEVETRYGADLEAFVEKRFGDSFSVRLTASNLLDANKDEVFHKFDTLADQVERDYDEYEIETEHAGPAVQLIGRWSF